MFYDRAAELGCCRGSCDHPITPSSYCPAGLKNYTRVRSTVPRSTVELTFWRLAHGPGLHASHVDQGLAPNNLTFFGRSRLGSHVDLCLPS